MDAFRKKKKYGQHFLTDPNISRKIAESMNPREKEGFTVLEIGPGQGSLTTHLLERGFKKLYLIEIDTELIAGLKEKFPALKDQIINADFLKFELSSLGSPIYITGNFPYNISSQILFKIIENHEHIPGMVGMFQKEVALRINAKPRTKDYGILSVLTQAYYDISYLFTVNNKVFSPPPKVDSGVIKLEHKKHIPADYDPDHFKKIVKASFNQRRKTLRNSLHLFQQFFINIESDFLGRRPEELSVEEFIYLARRLKQNS